MYAFYGVYSVLFLLFFTAQTADNDKKTCPRGMIPKFCTQSGSGTECVKDARDGMANGHWDIDFEKGNHCILRCDPGFVPNGCHVQRGWIDSMPTCIKDDWKRKAKEWGKTGLKVTVIGVVAVASGTAVVAATPVVLGLVGFSSSGVVAGSAAAGVQSASTAAGSLFAWAQSVGAVGYVGTAGSVVIGGTSALAAGVATYYIISAFTGCNM